MVCGNFILPEPASYVFFYALFNLRNLLYLIHNPKQLNNQQRGQHRRLGNAHGARDDPEAVSFRRAGDAPWAALAGCIMPPNLFGHTMSGHSWGSHEVAYFVGKGETNGAIELSRLRGSERYAVCFDARQAAVAGVASSQDPFHEL